MQIPRRLFLLTWMLLLPLGIFAQHPAIDLHAIQKATQQKKSEFYYPKLAKRMQAFDPELGQAEFQMLYYGQAYTDAYTPYGDDDETELMKLFRQADYKEVLDLGKKSLQANPANLRTLRIMLLTHDRLGDTIQAQRYADHYFPLIQTILHSGDGQSLETAMVVVRAQDEYDVLNYLGLESVGQSLIGQTDLQNINPEGQPLREGEVPITELYFDVSLPLNHLHRQLSKGR
jgi:hypothetical protein